MVVVWAVFAGTGLLLAACGFIAGRIKGEMAPVFGTASEHSPPMIRWMPSFYGYE
jgi:hypothetical protein